MIVFPTYRIDPDTSIERSLDPKPNLGYKFERKLAHMIVTATEEYICKRAQFLPCFYIEMKHCLPENINILRNIKCIFFRREYFAAFQRANFTRLRGNAFK